MNRIELLNQILEYTIWKQIDGYENYEASICGKVRNVITKRIMKFYLRNGYYHIKLYKNNQYKHFKIHRLVAKTFLPKLDINSKLC